MMHKAQREYDEQQKMLRARHTIQSEYNKVMGKLEEKGFNQMVREGFIIPEENAYQV